MDKKIRVLTAKPGLDGHDRGVKVVTSALMDAGMEVVYTGLRQTPVQIVEAAVQEDVDVIAMSILSGAHDYLFPKVMELLKEKGVDDMLVIGGGISGIEASLQLADLGHKVILVEKGPTIGGKMAQLNKIFPDQNCSR